MDPVIVVGAGPVGLSLSLALARQGVPSVVLDEGPGKDEQRPARTAVLRPDTVDLVERLTGVTFSDCRWAGWRSMRRRQVMRRLAFEDVDIAEDFEDFGGPGDSGDFGDFGDGERGGDLASPYGLRRPGDAGAPEDSEDLVAGGPSPVHVAQHVLTGALRDAVAGERLIKVALESRLDSVEQDAGGVTAHIRGPKGTWWRGSYLVGCDGPRSTVRKLLDIRFPGRTAVERRAVAALRTELPWPGEAVLHRAPPWRAAPPEVTARPLAGGVWRLDWLLPSRTELVTPDALVARIRDTLAGWCGGSTPPYELLDTGVHTVHHRLARRWRVGRCFVAGDAAHLLGALGTQGVDEGLRDVDNLAWKLGRCWHHGPSKALLDSYQAERRTAVAARLRACDQALPILRGGGGLRALVPGAARGHEALLTDGHLGHGPLGAPPSYGASPLSPKSTSGVSGAASVSAEVTVGTGRGAPVADVRVTAPDGSSVRLRDRLGLDRLLVVLVAPGTGVWERRHWLTAGVMPRLAGAVSALPVHAELLVAESYPGAAAHTVLLVRPDGHLVTAFAGVRPAELYAAADTARGGEPVARRARAPKPEPQERSDSTQAEPQGTAPAADTA
ncbi:FAD-dependent monooxygenase [Streptomyces apocyni]|uniref:FAD-dependent monooxygenase n=1 Tax=Streptomyces apocyni TaxID=2654677 RepID=UPI0012EA52EC|nr:FAD-dependent monooxygenase [Streptomyces apocyni]